MAARSEVIGLALVVLLLVALPTSVQSQNPERFVFNVYGMADGLSHGTVEAILQDSVGFVWIATHDGVDRFDGTTFHAYRSDREDPTSLTNDYVLALAEGPGGQLWVGTDGGGLDLLDPLTGTAVHFGLEKLGPWQTDAETATSDREGRTVYGVAVTTDGTLLLRTDAGLAWFDPTSGQYGPRAHGSSANATVLCRLPDGSAVVGFKDGTLELFGTGRPGSGATTDSRDDRRLPPLSGEVDALRCDGGRAEVLAATSDGGIWSLDFLAGGSRVLASLPSVSTGVMRVFDLLRMPEGTVWIATNQGTWRLPSDTTEPLRVTGDESGRSLPHVEVRRLLVDSRGVLWIGTWNGLASLHPLQAVIRRVLAGAESSSGLRGQGVIAVAPDSQGRTWVGADGGGIQRLVGDWRFGDLRAESSPGLDRWRGSVVFGLTSDLKGGVWAAAYTDGILHVTSDGNVVQVPAEDDGGRLVTEATYSVFVDRSGTVWAGTESLGLLRLDTERQRFIPLLGPSERDRLGSAWIWPITEDGQGRLWVGAINGGLGAIGPDRTSIDLFQAGVGGLSDNRVLCVFVDSEGIVWAGTEGGGLNRLDPSTDRFAVYTTEEGLPHDNVQAIAEDQRGFLWVSTNDGLARFDRKSQEFLVFTSAAGLAGDRFFANAVHRDSAGALYFGGSAGVTIFDPADIGRSETAPTVALTAFRIQGREVPLARAVRTTELVLKPDENFFAFEFAAMDFADVSQNRYRYMLDGLDPDWVDAGNTPVANYTSVPPDRYVFRVAARNSEGIWNENALSLPVQVLAPYYATWWFRSLMILAVFSLITSLYIYRLRQLEARQRLRLEIAGKLHDDIGANLSNIALKAEMVRTAATLDDRRRKVLGDVGRLSRETAHKVRETVWVVNTQYDTLAKLLGHMHDTADTLLAGHVEYSFSDPENAPDRAISMEFRQNVHLLFKEALNNVVKHAAASRVDVAVSLDQKVLGFRVADDGTGFDAASAREGNGQKLMQGRADAVRGRLQVTSTPGAGTVVEFSARLR